MYLISYSDITRVSPKFCNILIYASLQHIYHLTKAVQAMEGTHCSYSIMVVGVLTHYTLLYSVLFRNLYFTSLNWAIVPRKQPKTFVVQKVKV